MHMGWLMAIATLFIGPYFGEFGHELGFAGMARYRARRPVPDAAEYERATRSREAVQAPSAYGKVIVCTRPARHALYADFATEFQPHSIECEGVIASATAATAPSPKLVARYVPSDAQRFAPVEYKGSPDALWHKYGRRRNEYADAVVIHARSRPHCPERNWSQRNWNTLARRMFREGVAKRIICVGLRRHALAVEGALDMRDAPLATTMDVLASARWAVGPSSGPLHLATFCGCPVLVWCGGGASERDRTRKRYIVEWNPFKTFVHAHRHASWQPSLDLAWTWTAAFVQELGA